MIFGKHFHVPAQIAAAVVAALVAPCSLPAQTWDPLGRLATALASETGSKLKIGAEFRSRYESRTGTGFGRESGVSAALLRTRLSMQYTPAPWIKFSGMVQDSRAPFYGPNAPATVRDSAGLHESYVELFPNRKTGFGLMAGRAMLNYGEARLLGSPQWGNLARTYDHARVYYRAPWAQVELLLVSPVKIRLGEFNRPVLGDRVWGMYNSFPNLFGKTLVEAYLLRHGQNHPGGFTGGSRAAGTDRMEVNTFGWRMTGPAPAGARYSLENAFQTGAVGPATHRGLAWFSGVSRRWQLCGKPLDLSAEYKYASGTADPSNPNRVGTFDQLYPANHDKFGHQDLFGWRNIHNARGLAVWEVARNLAVHFMYGSFWLASPRDALYNGSGKAIVRSSNGAAGRRVGQEADSFLTYKYGRFTVGAGCSYFFKGPFIGNTTPGVNPAYVYVFQTYTL